MQVVDSKEVQLSLWSVAKFPLLVFLSSLTLFTLAFFFFRILFDIVLYINTIVTLVTIFFSVTLGIVPLFLKRKASDKKNSPNHEKVSIIVPVFNDADVLEPTLKQILELSYPKYEILIVYSEKSTDRTEEVSLEFAEKYDNVRAFPENISKGNALNIGTANAEGDFILVLDSDTIIFDGFIERALSHFSEDNIKCVSSVFLGLNTKQTFITLMAWALFDNMNFYAVETNKYVQDINFTGFGGMWRKSALIECGGFASDTRSEEIEITYRILTTYPDWKGVYDEHLFCYQLYPDNVRLLYLQQMRWTVGKFRYMMQSIRKIGSMGWGKKFIFLSATFMLAIFPMIIWFSMGMTFIQFFVNFFEPDISFGGGIFFFILAILSFTLAFSALTFFIYPVHRRRSRVILSRKLIIFGVFIILLIGGMIYGIIALNALKQGITNKGEEIFIKMDKSTLKGDSLQDKLK